MPSCFLQLLSQSILLLKIYFISLEDYLLPILLWRICPPFGPFLYNSSFYNFLFAFPFLKIGMLYSFSFCKVHPVFCYMDKIVSQIFLRILIVLSSFLLLKLSFSSRANSSFYLRLFDLH